MEKKQKNQHKHYLIYSFVALIVACIAYAEFEIYSIKAELQTQNAKIQANRVVLFYNLEEVLRATDAVNQKTKFEGEIIKLNDEVFAAEEKIKSLKEAKVKEDFTDVYLSNLKMKRDNLVSEYEKTIKALTDKINIALVEIAKEHNAAVIFVQSALAVNTPETIDVTDEIIKKIKSK